MNLATAISRSKKIIPYVFVVFLAGFGLITLFLSTSVILDLFDVRAKEGNYVLFVVWTNFISSIIYLFAAYGFITHKKWAAPLLGASVIILIIGLSGLFIHINGGGIYETKTVRAMIIRIALTTFFSVIAFVHYKEYKAKKEKAKLADK